MQNPYLTYGAEAFWRSAVAEPGADGLAGLWQPRFGIGRDDGIVTFGSCFAQHFGRALVARDYRWIDAEPAPPFLKPRDAAGFHYGTFSARTGNIYTPTMLLQWLKLALDAGPVPDEAWSSGGRWFDPLRPAIEPDGLASADECRALRQATLAALRRAVTEASLFTFTLGLTECWVNAATGLEYALCPGTTAGAEYSPDAHVFCNRTFAELYIALDEALVLLRAANPDLKILLTVSPVPLTATASGDHVLTATSRSKAVLRAVTAEIRDAYDFVDYFPSYEIITHPIFQGRFYAPNQRSVLPEGVDTVMRHFFTALGEPEAPMRPKRRRRAAGRKRKAATAAELRCEEEMLDAFSK